MKTVKTIQEVRAFVKQCRKENKTIGLVPTMGFLHEGHGSLMQKSVSQNDITIVSIFLNPTQFAPTEDLSIYPRDLQGDQALCEKLGVDLIFHPEPAEIYQNACTYVNINLLSDGLCGKSRPTHFQGVCTVVSKLFLIATPDRAYFGEKDAQQLAIIKKMVQDLNFDLEIVGCPTVREADGLAKSSRNVHLSKDERLAALCLYKSIQKGLEVAKKTRDANTIQKEMVNIISQEPLAHIDYIEVVNPLTLQPIEQIDGDALVAMAVFVGKTRLLDNFTISHT